MNHFHLYLYGPNNGPLPASFDQAAARLQETAGCSFEPDGSFGFVANRGQERLFGMLYDAGGVLQYVDLQGQVSLGSWLCVLAAVVGEKCDGQLVVLQLPGRVLKSLQDFQCENWPPGPVESAVLTHYFRC